VSWKPDKFPPCGCSVRGLGGCKMTPFGMNVCDFTLPYEGLPTTTGSDLGGRITGQMIAQPRGSSSFMTGSVQLCRRTYGVGRRVVHPGTSSSRQRKWLSRSRWHGRCGCPWCGAGAKPQPRTASTSKRLRLGCATSRAAAASTWFPERCAPAAKYLG